ncbi:MAG: DUF3796 domain-containing protein [Angelakisella sp.]|jgi:hypothetical protein|nr:DUF3796 domain-containing protein [Angelakisella sp.]
MKNNKVKLWTGGGIICVVAMLLSVWYAITFNDSRLVVPMDFSRYSFIPQDLPMILSVSLFCIYTIALCLSLLIAARKNKRDITRSNTTRRIDPRLGFLGLLGFLGFAGFWSYPATGDISPFLFFLFFGFFGFFYEGKMSGTLMDERFRENAARAQLVTYRTTFGITLLALLILCQGKLLGSLEYTLIATVIVLSLTLALGIFLPEYLLYRYDHDDRMEEGEDGGI